MSFPKVMKGFFFVCLFFCFVFGFAFYGVECGTMSNLLEFGGFLDSVFCLVFFGVFF